MSGPKRARPLLSRAVALLAVCGAVSFSVHRVAAEGSPEEALTEGSEITVGPTARVLRPAPGVELKIAAGSRFRVKATTKLSLGALGEPRCTQLELANGSIEFSVLPAKPLQHSVLVRAAGSVSALPAGGSGLVIAERGGVTVASFDGRLIVAKGNDWRPLEAGWARSFGEGRDERARPLLRAPERVDVPQLIGSWGESGASANASVDSVPGAASYRFRVVRRDGSLVTELESPKPTLALPTLPSGLYTVAVQAVDSSGLGGRSRAGQTRVLALTLPAGSLVHGSPSNRAEVELGAGQPIGIQDFGELELDYGARGEFVPAPALLRLVSKRATKVVLRPRAEPANQLEFLLVPREVKASVRFSPSQPTWPRDRLAIAVTLTTARGRPLPESFKVVAKVSVNAEPVLVPFRRKGAELTATVPAPARPGPWVLRLVLEDAFGGVLARDFVEIATSPNSAGSPTAALR